MRRLIGFAVTLTMALATTGVLGAAPAWAATQCPPNPAPGSTVIGDLVVPNGQTCQLAGVTVTGSVRVAANARLNVGSDSGTPSRIEGNVTLGNNASLIFNSSTLEGSINATNQPRDVVLYFADFGGSPPTEVFGDINVTGATQHAALCGADVGGNVNITNTASTGRVTIGGSDCDQVGF